MHTWWRVNLSDWCWVSSAPWEYFHRYAHVAKLTKISATWRSTRSMQTQSWRLSCPCIPDTLRTLKPSAVKWSLPMCVWRKKFFSAEIIEIFWDTMSHSKFFMAEIEDKQTNDIQSLSLPSCTSCLDVHSCKVVTSRKGSLVEKFIWNFSNSLLLQSSNPNWPKTCQLPTFFLFEHCGLTARGPYSQVPHRTCSWMWHTDTCQLGNLTMTLLLNAVHIAQWPHCGPSHWNEMSSAASSTHFQLSREAQITPLSLTSFLFSKRPIFLYWFDLMILTLQI